MCHSRSWGHWFGHEPFGFLCEHPTKEEKAIFLEFMKKRLSRAIERLDERISELKAEDSESED
jgi:hypothetical protein